MTLKGRRSSTKFVPVVSYKQDAKEERLRYFFYINDFVSINDWKFIGAIYTTCFVRATLQIQSIDSMHDHIWNQSILHIHIGALYLIDRYAKVAPFMIVRSG